MSSSKRLYPKLIAAHAPLIFEVSETGHRLENAEAMRSFEMPEQMWLRSRRARVLDVQTQYPGWACVEMRDLPGRYWAVAEQNILPVPALELLAEHGL